MPSKFDNNVEWIPFLDHNPPTLDQIKSFCYQVEKWLLLDPDNVVAVHCKGGKGRTGMMIACYLLSHGCADETPIRSAQEAIDFFAQRRTAGGLKGCSHPQTVTGVSQKRYVGYFEDGLKGSLQFCQIQITKVEFTKVPDTGSKFFQPVLRVSTGAHELYRSDHRRAVRWSCFGGASSKEIFQAGEDRLIQFECSEKKLFVAADVKLELFDGMPHDEEGQKLSDQAVCFACLHASKAEASPICLNQQALDVGKHKVFPPGFEMRVHFEILEPKDPSESRPLTFKEDQQLWFAHKVMFCPITSIPALSL